MEGSIKDLVSIRFDRAKEMLGASQVNFEQGELKTSLNRSYYAIFHAMRSVNLISGFDSSKHSGVIAHFNQYYLKTNELDSSLSDIIKNAKIFLDNVDKYIKDNA